MRFRKPLLALAVLPLVVAVGAAQGKHAMAGWKTDFAKAQAESKKTGKLMLVDFNAVWCGPCKRYKKEVFPNTSFKSATKDVILVEVDIDKQPTLAQKFGVTGIPDIRFIGPDGKQLGKVKGYRGEKLLLDELAKAKSALKR